MPFNQMHFFASSVFFKWLEYNVNSFKQIEQTKAYYSICQRMVPLKI